MMMKTEHIHGTQIGANVDTDRNIALSLYNKKH